MLETSASGAAATAKDARARNNAPMPGSFFVFIGFYVKADTVPAFTLYSANQRRTLQNHFEDGLGIGPPSSESCLRNRGSAASRSVVASPTVRNRSRVAIEYSSALRQ